MQKWWSVFFGVVLAATFGIWVIAPFMGWWLPPNVASYGGQVDDLFYVILGFTGFFFVLTEAIMVYAMWRFSHREGHKSDYTHGNHKLEVFWTAVPAAILVFIAFAQVKAWENIKYQSRMPPPDMTVQVTARQWEWRMRYPYETTQFTFTADTDPTQVQVVEGRARRWAEVPEYDDIHVPNELHAWQGANVKMYLRTLDVLHSFYLPNLRLKQDALPGKTIPMWFMATAANTVRSDLPNEWLGNKDPQLWKDELSQIQQLKEEATKKEKLAQAEKGDAKTKLEAEVSQLQAEMSKIRSQSHPNHAWEVACAELCGARHAYMRGRLYVHPTREDFEAWLAHAYRQQRSRQP